MYIISAIHRKIFVLCELPEKGIFFQIVETFETKCRFSQRIILEKKKKKKEQDKNLQLKLLDDLYFKLFLC